MWLVKVQVGYMVDFERKDKQRRPLTGSPIQRSVSRRLYQAHDVSQHPGVQKYVLGNLCRLFNLFLNFADGSIAEGRLT